MILNLGSIESHGFGESVSGVRRFGNLLGNTKKKKTHSIFPTTEDSMNACMELVGFSASNKVKNRWAR